MNKTGRPVKPISAGPTPYGFLGSKEMRELSLECILYELGMPGESVFCLKAYRVIPVPYLR
ncbi:MAG: hypothetical protein NTNFB02_04810 [Nitrospira sp.]